MVVSTFARPKAAIPNTDAEDAGGEPLPSDSGTSTPTKASQPPPDGGCAAWLQVLGLWAVFAVTWGLTNTFGVFQAYYEKQLLATTSSSAISWIGSLQGALLLMTGSVSGALHDAGYFRQLLLGGLALIVLGQFMTSLASEYWHFVLAQGICIGLGCGLAYVPSTALLSQYFRRHQALALGVASTGSPIIGIVFPIVFGRLQSTIGFPWTCRVMAFVVLFLSLIPVFLLRVRVPAVGPRRSMVDKSVLRDCTFLLFMCGGFIAFLSLYIGYFYIQQFALESDISSSDFAPYFVTLLNAGSIPGRLLPNFLADQLGHLNMQAVLSALTTVVMFAWMGVHNMGGLTAFALLYGGFTGGLMTIVPPVTIVLTPDPSRIGTRMGMVTFTLGTAVLVGPPIAGAILGDYSRTRWLGMMGYAGATLFTATIFFVLARLTWNREAQSPKQRE